MKKLNILIVEDHELTRFGLKATFEGSEIAGNIYEANSAEKALDIILNNSIDLVIMDLGLPGMNGIVASRKINDLNRGIKIIILTSHNDEQEVIQSLKAGANAYCSKEINPVRLLEVAASVLDGASWFDPSIAHIVLRAASNTQMNDVSQNKKDYNLTIREKQILKLITEGYSNIDVAKELCVTVNTTKAHVASILQKLEVEDRLQAALKALNEKLV